MARARAAHRAAEARRRHGRRGAARSSTRSRSRSPTRSSEAGRAAALHADDRGARRRPTSTRRSTSSPRRRASGTPSSPSGPGGPSCRRTERPRVGAVAALLVALLRLTASSTAADARPVAGRRCSSALVLIPAVFLLVLLALPLAHARGLLPVGVAAALARACVLGVADLDVARELREARRDDAPRRSGSSASSRSSRGSCSSRASIPCGRRVLGLARADERRSSTSTASVFAALSFAFPVPGEGASPARPARPPLLRALPRRRRALGLRVLDVARADRLVRRDDGARDLRRPFGSAACRRCRCSRSASCSRTPTCSGAGSATSARPSPTRKRRVTVCYLCVSSGARRRESTRSSSATVSTCGVCGNMSTGRARTSR